MGCKYRVMDKCKAKDNIKDAFCFGKDGCPYYEDEVKAISSGLEKNSQKLEKDFGELDCISRAEVLKLMKDNWHTHNGDWAMQESMDDIRALPAIKPQEPILDRIRAEIEKEIIPRKSDQYDHEAMWQNMGLRIALKMIDKYKAESEDKE